MAGQGQGQGQGQGSFFKRKHEVLSMATGVSFTCGSPPAGGSIAPPPPPGEIRPVPPNSGKIQPSLHAQAIYPNRHRVDNSDGSCGGCICCRSLGSSTSAGASNQTKSQPGVKAVALECCGTLENSIDSAQVTSLCMKIPHNKLALIIGEGYDNINWMQSKSGASILLLPGDISGETTMHINGKPENVNIAKELVDTILSEGYYRPPLKLGYPGRPPKKVLGHAYRPPGGAAPPSNDDSYDDADLDVPFIPRTVSK